MSDSTDVSSLTQGASEKKKQKLIEYVTTTMSHPINVAVERRQLRSRNKIDERNVAAFPSIYF